MECKLISKHEKRVTRSTQQRISVLPNFLTEEPPDQSMVEKTITKPNNKKKTSEKITIKQSSTCPLCNGSFDSLKKFKAHKLKHAADGQQECPVCLKKFEDIEKLFKHLGKHKSAKKLADPTASSTASNKVFQCSICGQSFEEIAALDIHIRIHLAIEPYICSVCDAKYQSIQQLFAHINTSHSGNDHRFACHYCGIVVDSAKQFSEHDERHKGGKAEKSLHCDECDQSCVSLDDHKRTQTDARKSYSCLHCVECFSRSEDLHVHMRVHKGQSVFKCASCGRMFAQAKNLSGHVQRIHKGSFHPDELLLIDFVVDSEVQERKRWSTLEKAAGEVYCLDVVAMVKALGSSTDSTVPPSPTKEVIMIYQPVNITCTDGSFRQSNLIRKYRCPLCPLAFVKIKTLQIHCKRNHIGLYDMEQINEIERRGNKAAEAWLQQSNVPPPLDCPGCESKFDSHPELINHLKSNHDSSTPFKCADCEVKFSKASALSKHVVVHLEKRHKCPHCNIAFQQITSLQKHVKRHEGATATPCSVCGIPYKDDKDFQRHMRTHAEGKPHKCDHCEKRFAQSCDKNKHMRIHTGERPYSCKVCDKTFGHLTSYKKHQFVHTGERPYQCTVCGKSFQHNSNLVVHSRMHTGERPYKCNVCDKSFYASGHYTDHMKIHVGARNYKCDVCPKSFLHLSSFQKHKRTHTGEKPFHCTMCDRRFSQPGHYKEHMRIHSGEKPYCCKLCDKTFRRSDALQGHLKTHVEQAPATVSTVALAPAEMAAEPIYTMETVNYPISNISNAQQGDSQFSHPHHIIIHRQQSQQLHQLQPELFILQNHPIQAEQQIDNNLRNGNMEADDTLLLVEEHQQSAEQSILGGFSSFGYNYNL